MPKAERVYQAILDRTNASTGSLREALKGLSEMRKESSIPVILKLVGDRDQAGQTEALKGLRELLLEQPLAEIRKNRGALQNLATKAKQAETRQLGYAAWATAEGNGDAPFATASTSKEGLRDLLKAIPGIANADLKKNLFASARTLMFDLPSALEAEPKGTGLQQAGIQVDYFYPAPDNVAAETLAAIKPTDSGIVPQIVMNVPQRKQADDFALRFTGNIIIPKAGKYTFFVASDDGSRIYVDDKLLVDNDRLQGMTERSGSVELTAGPHK
ncbi:MAG: PA14 domain-containing protein, partial [Pirellula sp.]